MVLSGMGGTIGSIAQILGMLAVFVMILAGAYFVSRYLGKYATRARENSNIKIIETSRVTADKYLQIIEAGERYFLIGITKTNISLISELDLDKENSDKAKSKEK